MSALRILLVDDEESIREVFAAFLGIEGHTVQTAEDGDDGLRVFRGGTFDLVITDKAIPGMSGNKLAVKIKQLAPTTPVILLSGYHEGGEDEPVPGVDVLATKPITFPDLREAIRRAMACA